MTIAKGQPWGTPGQLPDGAPVVGSDAELSALVAASRRNGTTLGPVGLLGGDLAKTVGSRGNQARLASDEAVHLPIDVASVLIDGTLHHFVAHLVARRSWWHGRVVAVMNAQWLGKWDVAPRSHPNDGLLDVFDADLRLADRAKAWKRLLTGTHVPHPQISQRRSASVEIELDRLTPIWLDGTLVGRGQALTIEIHPDALCCVV